MPVPGRFLIRRSPESPGLRGDEAEQTVPIYVYQPDAGSGCEHCRSGFEILQKLRDAPLEHCPRCLAPLRKVVGAPSLSNSSPSLSDHNVERHGFTRYRKLERGVYEKTAGTGPRSNQSPLSSKIRTGSGQRTAALSRPFTSYGVAGTTTRRPGPFMNIG